MGKADAQLEPLVDAGQGIVIALLLDQHRTQIDVRIAQAGIQRHGLAGVRRSLVGAAQHVQKNTAIVMGRGPVLEIGRAHV